MLARAWIAAARLRRRLGGAPPAREELIRRHVAGRSFLDVGCMWSVHGAVAFAAEEAGATAVTGMDVMGATPEYEAEHARRGSAMRFVHGDLHDGATIDAAGPHDVVWCSGLLYHAPHPVLSLERLRELTGETLILATEALPEVPGLRGACVFYPGADRRIFSRVASGTAIGLTTPFDPAAGYGNWWWGITPSALRGMLRATGFELVEEIRRPFHVTVVATVRR